MYGNSYYSEEKVEQRFLTAIKDKKADKLESMIIHEDGSSISKIEAKALLKYSKEYGVTAIKNELKIKNNGFILGIVKKNKISFSDYYAQMYEAPKGLTFTFDKKSFPKTKVDEETDQYGPLIPGIYLVNATLTNDFGKSSKNYNITIQNDDVSIDNISFFNDSLEIAGFNPDTMKNAKLVANGQELNVDQDGYTDEIGPVISGSKLDLQFSATMPWGERTSKINLEDDSDLIYPSITDDSDIKTIEETIAKFYEQRMQYLAQGNASVLTTTTNDFKSRIIEDYLYSDGIFAGKVDKIHINTSQISINNDYENSIDIYTKVDSDYGSSDFESVEQLDHHEDYYLLTLAYNPSKKIWLISNLTEDDDESEENMNDVLVGKKEVYNPSASLEDIGDLKDASSEKLTSSFETILSNAYSKYVYAVNNDDFDSIADLYIEDSPSYKETEKAIPNYFEKGIQEEFQSVSVKAVQKEGNTVTVTSEDEYMIDHPEKGKRLQTFNTKTILKYSGGSWKLYKLLSTTLKNSENY